MSKDKLKLIVAGTRTFNDYSLLEDKLDSYMTYYNVTIISGCASGADTLAIRYAKQNSLTLIEKPADWNNLEGIDPKNIKINKYGKPYNSLAGFERNEEMAKIADALIVFWDGKSKGTANMIELATKYNLQIQKVIYTP